MWQAWRLLSTPAVSTEGGPGCDRLSLRILGSDFFHLLQSGSLGDEISAQEVYKEYSWDQSW